MIGSSTICCYVNKGTVSSWQMQLCGGKVVSIFVQCSVIYPGTERTRRDRDGRQAQIRSDVASWAGSQSARSSSEGCIQDCVVRCKEPHRRSADSIPAVRTDQRLWTHAESRGPPPHLHVWPDEWRHAEPLRGLLGQQCMWTSLVCGCWMATYTTSV